MEPAEIPAAWLEMIRAADRAASAELAVPELVCHGPGGTSGRVVGGERGVSDPYRLELFVAAQDRNGTYDRAIAELRDGEKRSHWMWFIFPQVSGLGFSAMSQEFSISGLDEARAYLRHPVLGPRLVECTRIVAATEGRTAADIFGGVDAMKLRSSMTLFKAATADDEPENDDPFADVLAKYFEGAEDEATRSLL